MSELLPNKEVLINVIPLLEAQASSEIENIVTTRDQLFRNFVLLKEPRDLATREALNYRRALHRGGESMASGGLDVGVTELICSEIKQEPMALRSASGTRLQNDRSGDIIYTPPEGEVVLRELLANWVAFFDEPGELDPLIAMAVQHYQFEAIHPFADGNGRTGRILNLLHLVRHGLLSTPILYHSRGIIRRKPAYYEALMTVTRSGDWEPWLLYMLQVVEESARWTCGKIGAIRELQGRTRNWLRESLPKIYSVELLHVLYTQPYCRIGDLVSAGVAQRQTASVWLKQLVAAGLLEEETVGREKLFVNPGFLDLLLNDEDGDVPSAL